jgi:spermidine synthase
MTAPSTAPTATAGRPQPSQTSPRRAAAELFLVSFVILFLELSCIRWFGSTVVFLGFFTNLVLMACFLGMTVGCLAASRRRDLIHGVIPLTLVAAALAFAALLGYTRFLGVRIDVGGQGASPQQIFFGADVRLDDPSRFVVPIEAVAGAFYALIALVFVGLGQAMGRRFNAIPDRVLAYSVDVGGSLVGITAFGLASWLRWPPVAWFAIGLGPVLGLARRSWPFQAACLLGLLALAAYSDRAGLSDLDRNGHAEVTWSPYYKVQFHPRKNIILANTMPHQQMVRVGRSGAAYMLPHLLNRDAGGAPFGDVLVIGAGSGNDVAAALAGGARHVDAVEIDPLIHELGRAHHPDRPYDDPRVSVHLDDGRSFLRKTGRKYDLVVYALVDSLVLHSGYSSLRLESFLFTEQALADVRRVLTPDGVFAMYNHFRRGWVVGRLETMARRAFGTEPLVISLPYQAEITPTTSQAKYITFVLVGNSPATAVDRVRRALREHGAFWVHVAPANNITVNGYGPAPPSGEGVPVSGWERIGPAKVDARGAGFSPTDDWPFLYLRDPTIPALNLRGMAIVAGISLVILFLFAPPGRAARPNGRMFFLGAGFMLLETKGVVHMALLFGSTWVVNSIVFFAILVMILLSNLHVLRFRPRNLAPAYASLIAALLVNAAVPMTVFLALPGAARVVVSCLVVFLPVFFAGVIFAASFRDSPSPDLDFGSNVGGVILGGLSENLSLVVGFNHLLFVAVAYYLLSAWLKPRALEHR